MIKIIHKLIVVLIILDVTQSFKMNDNWQCSRCLNAGQRACLTDLNGKTNWSAYTCCTPNSYVKYCWSTQAKYKYCTSDILEPKKKFLPLQNNDLRQWTCPIETNKCDKNVDIVIKEKDLFYNRTFQWNEIVPTPAAINWNCKYRISLD